MNRKGNIQYRELLLNMWSRPLDRNPFQSWKYDAAAGVRNWEVPWTNMVVYCVSPGHLAAFHIHIPFPTLNVVLKQFWCLWNLAVLGKIHVWPSAIQTWQRKSTSHVSLLRGKFAWSRGTYQALPSDFSGFLQFRLRQLQTSQSHRPDLGSRRVSEIFEGTLKAWTCAVYGYT